MANFLKTNIDFSKNFIRGAARLVIAEMTTPVPTELANVVRLTTASNANEVQTLTITGTPTGGTFTLTYKGYTTAGIKWNATAKEVEEALAPLSSVGTGGIVGAGSAMPSGSITLTFSNQLGNQAVPLVVPNSTGLTGGTTPVAAVARTTPGVGQYDALAGYTDLGATKGGITVSRNNAEETFSVDQILADILSLPSSWTQQVSASVAQADIDTLQYLWEGGTITVNGTTGERTLPLGAPTIYRKRRLVVLFQRQSVDGVTEGKIRGYVFRETTRTPQQSDIVHNKTGDQAVVAFTWNCFADQTVQDPYARFGAILDQA